MRRKLERAEPRQAPAGRPAAALASHQLAWVHGGSGQTTGKRQHKVMSGSANTIDWSGGGGGFGGSGATSDW